MGKLFGDLKTDQEKADFFLSGNGFSTGVIADCLQNDVALAYQRCANYKTALAQKEAEIAKLKHELKQDEYKFIRNHNDYYKELCGVREQVSQLQTELDRVIDQQIRYPPQFSYGVIQRIGAIMARLKALAVIMLPLALAGCQDPQPLRVYHHYFPPEHVVVHDNGEVTVNYCFSAPIVGKFSTRLHYGDSKGQIQIIHAREYSYMHAVRKWVGDGNEVVCDDFGATFAPSDLGKVVAVHVDYETTGGR